MKGIIETIAFFILLVVAVLLLTIAPINKEGNISIRSVPSLIHIPTLKK